MTKNLIQFLEVLSKPSSEQKKSSKLLVIRFSAMGDVSMAVPALRVFTKTYPSKKVVVLTRPLFKPMFSDIHNVEVVTTDLVARHKGLFGLYRLFKEVKEGISEVADIHNVIRTKVLGLFFRLSKRNVVQINKGRADKKALTRDQNKVFKQLKTSHQRYADVFKQLGYPIDLDSHDFPEKSAISPIIAALLPNTNNKKLGIAPFAQYKSKTYPIELMIEVISIIAKENTHDVFLFGGGKKEIEALSEIASRLDNVICVAGKLSFEDELALISNLDAMLAMDSGNAHLAAMYGVPTITVWGVTHPYAGFMPFKQPLENAILPDLDRYTKIPTSIYGNKVPEGYEDVMRTIAPQTIVDKINSLV